MPSYKVPLKDFGDILMMLNHQHTMFDAELCLDLLKQVSTLLDKEVAETNFVSDNDTLIFDATTGDVKTPHPYKIAHKMIKDQGLLSLPLHSKFGGAEAPWVLNNMVAECMSAGNIALSTYHMLTHGAIGVIESAAEDVLKDQYLPKMSSGDFSGTMCLTEPHCGTDLGLIRTKAEKSGDHYLLSGQKIWITFGEHDLSENIIHLVLARCVDSPKGVKGISIFLVPKFLPDGSRNQVKCVGLEHKMGQECSPTCVMKFDQAVGYMIGQQNKGMHAMFKMMNPARIGVGIQGLACSELAYQMALDFVKTRRQSRSLDPAKRQLDEEADLIWVHPDVRRMLLSVRASNFGMRMLVAQVSQWLDSGEDEFVGLMTPVIKSFCSDYGVHNTSICQQILGGSGYVKDFKIEQIYRDVRITTIYEGTNGIQALDLVGRKIAKDGGKALTKFLKWVESYANQSDLHGSQYLNIALKDIHSLNKFLLAHMTDPELIAFVASDYLRCIGHIAVMTMYVKMSATHPRYNKLSDFYASYVMAEYSSHIKRILAGKGQVMDDWKDIL